MIRSRVTTRHTTISYAQTLSNITELKQKNVHFYTQ